MSALDRAVNTPFTLEEHASLHLAGGISNRGYQCGIVWGAALFAGAQAYRLYGTAPVAETEAIMASQGVVELFRGLTKNRVDCHDITGLDLTGKIQLTRQSMKFVVKGGPVYCARLIVNLSRAVYNRTQTPCSEKSIEASPGPVSCSALLAQKAGASDIHAVMAAGFAGGIGLSGGGCGALAAAIWITAMNHHREEAVNKMNYPVINDLNDKFMKNTDSRLTCSEIVGRKFKGIADHTAYLRDGGCSEIIDLLAGEASA